MFPFAQSYRPSTAVPKDESTYQCQFNYVKNNLDNKYYRCSNRARLKYLRPINIEGKIFYVCHTHFAFLSQPNRKCFHLKNYFVPLDTTTSPPAPERTPLTTPDQPVPETNNIPSVAQFNLPTLHKQSEKYNSSNMSNDIVYPTTLEKQQIEYNRLWHNRKNGTPLSAIDVQKLKYYDARAEQVKIYNEQLKINQAFVDEFYPQAVQGVKLTPEQINKLKELLFNNHDAIKQITVGISLGEKRRRQEAIKVHAEAAERRRQEAEDELVSLSDTENNESSTSTPPQHTELDSLFNSPRAQCKNSEINLINFDNFNSDPIPDKTKCSLNLVADLFEDLCISKSSSTAPLDDQSIPCTNDESIAEIKTPPSSSLCEVNLSPSNIDAQCSFFHTRFENQNITKGIEWIEYLERKYNYSIEHSPTGYYLADIDMCVDGYERTTNTVYLFYDDAYFGNPLVYVLTDINPALNKTCGELFTTTVTIDAKIRQHGYQLVTIWEQDWNKIKPDRSTTKENSQYNFDDLRYDSISHLMNELD